MEHVDVGLEGEERRGGEEREEGEARQVDDEALQVGGRSASVQAFQ